MRWARWSCCSPRRSTTGRPPDACYGGWESTVRVVRLEPRRPRFEPTVSGEALRALFADRIDGREPDVEAA